MILFTGMTGLTGQALYDELCCNHFDEPIRIVTRKTSNNTIFEGSPLDLELVYGDVRDVDFLVKALQGCDTLMHIAAKDYSDFVLEAVRRSPQIKKIIMVSSTIIYSQFYSGSRLNIIEPQMRDYCHKQGIKIVFIRPTMIYGPGDKNISQFVNWFRKYPFFPIVKRGSATIQPVYYRDVAKAYWLILKNLPTVKQEDYVVSGEKPYTLLELFKVICTIIKRKVIFVNCPMIVANGGASVLFYISMKRIDIREKVQRLGENRAYSHEDITEELQYMPRSFEVGLAEVLDQYTLAR